MELTIANKQRQMQSLRNLKRYTKKELSTVQLEGCNAIVYTYEVNDRFYAIGFRGKAKKHTFFYYFKSEEKRKDYANTFLQNIQECELHKAKRTQEKKMAKQDMSNKIQVGTILTGSWGYEQTNREFYQVVEKTSNFKVSLRPIAHINIPGTECFDSCMVRPIKDKFTGSAVTKMITAWGIGFDHFNLTVCDPKGKYYKSWGY
jgi:hypothetical protein